MKEKEPEREQRTEETNESRVGIPSFFLKALKVIDFVGEYLASFLGITDSKYSEEVLEHERVMEEQSKKDEESTTSLSQLEKGENKEENQPTTTNQQTKD